MTIGFWSALATSLISYAILAGSLLGFGWAAASILHLDFPSQEKPFNFIWVGWAVLLVLLQVFHLIVPVAAPLSLCLLALGIVLCARYLSRVWRRSRASALPSLFLILLAAAAVWIAAQSMFSPANYDSGLYHLNTIRWFNEHPIVLGLGNLHSRLAYNQSLFIFAASLNLYPLFNHGYNLADSFLLLVLLAECVYSLVGLILSRGRGLHRLAASLPAVALLPILVYVAASSSLSSPSPDTTSIVLQMLVFMHFLRALDETCGSRAGQSRLQFLFILSATAITVKLSNLAFVLAVCGILFFLRWRASLLPAGRFIRQAILWFGLPILIIAVWGLRSLFLSGCPVFPVPLGCLPVSWAMPRATVRGEAAWIMSWARQPHLAPGHVFASWAWLKPWFFREIWGNTSTAVYPLVITILIGAASLFLTLRRPSARKVRMLAWLVPLPVCLGLLYWFLAAPDIRFAHALFWLLPVAAAILLLNILESSRKLHWAWLIAIFLIVNLTIFAWEASHISELVSVSPTGYQALTVASLSEKETRWGLEVWVPTQTDQCWDSALPCTPYFNEYLKFVNSPVFPEFKLASGSPK